MAPGFRITLALVLLVNLVVVTIRAEKRLSWSAKAKQRYKAEIGHFNNSAPFDNVKLLPLDPEEIATEFWLYSNGNSSGAFVFPFFRYKQMKSWQNYNGAQETKFVIHGFGGHCANYWVQQMKDALLTVAPNNVVCVHWKQGAAKPNYRQAVANVRLVAKQVSLLITDLQKAFPDQKFHLIGHSLGAQVAGQAGWLNKNIDRISGLDPASPLFEETSRPVHLDKTDARFVDIIHTSGSSMLYGGFGISSPVGHVDFYPNGGIAQVGCPKHFIDSLIVSSKQTAEEKAIQATDPDFDTSACSHQRVHQLYIESIVSKCPFNAFKCDSFEKFVNGDPACTNSKRMRPMGYYADTVPLNETEEVQKYYLITRGKSPFCGKQTLVNTEISPRQVETSGELEITLHVSYLKNSSEGPVADVIKLLSTADKLHPGQVIRKVVAAPRNQTALPYVTLRYVATKKFFTTRGHPTLEIETVAIRLLDVPRDFKTCEILELPSGKTVHLEAWYDSQGRPSCYSQA